MDDGGKPGAIPNPCHGLSSIVHRREPEVSKMRYGLEIPNGGECADPHFLAELAHIAEEAGWDGIFLEDYICYYSAPDAPTCDPWVALAGMALRTRRIRLGTTV